jgi:hypothetical protein
MSLKERCDCPGKRHYRPHVSPIGHGASAVKYGGRLTAVHVLPYPLATSRARNLPAK